MSSKDVLSEGELDALMETVSDEDAPAADPAFDKSCQAFDFNSRDQNLVAQLPLLKNLNEKFAMSLGPMVRNLYGFAAHVESQDATLQTLEEVFVDAQGPFGVNSVHIGPLAGTCYVVLTGELLSFFVERYFGGGGQAGTKAPTRSSLTHSERRVNDALTENFLETLAATWRDNLQLTTSIDAFESNPDFLQLPTPKEQVLSFPFVLHVGEWTSTISWVVPYSSIEQLRPILAGPAPLQKPTGKNTDWERHFLRELQNVTLDLRGAFQPELVSISEVLGMKEGTIVPLRMPSEVMVTIEGEPFSIGEHGVLNGNKSIKIKRMLLGES